MEHNSKHRNLTLVSYTCGYVINCGINYTFLGAIYFLCASVVIYLLYGVSFIVFSESYSRDYIFLWLPRSLIMVSNSIFIFMKGRVWVEKRLPLPVSRYEMMVGRSSRCWIPFVVHFGRRKDS